MSSSHPTNRISRARGAYFRTDPAGADYVGQQTEQVLKPHGAHRTQYNVLRILRRRGPEGLPCKSVGDLMISHDPDMTRLLDAWKSGGLIDESGRKTTGACQDADHTGWSRYPEKIRQSGARISQEEFAHHQRNKTKAA